MMGAVGPSVSVIIPHLNQQDALIRCLTSLKEQNFDGRVEIIIVDNGSRDPLDRVAAEFPHVLFDFEPEPGPGLARNRGAGRATADILLFIDADCRAHPGWITAAMAGLTGPDAAAICGGDVGIDMVNPAKLTGLEAYESVFAYRQARYISREGFSGTGNLGTTRRVFDAVGPFGGIGIAEDIDWGHRATAKGHVIRYAPNMIVYHPARTSFEDLAQKWRRHVAHDLANRRGKGQSPILWWLLAAAVIASILPHSLMVLASQRVSGLANKMRAIGILVRIRGFRCAEMLRQARSGGGGAAGWNR